MKYSLIVLLLVSRAVLAVISDDDLRRKRGEITQACRQEMYVGLEQVSKRFDAERDALIKANLPMNDYMKKTQELGARISDANRPVFENEQKCFLKMAPLDALDKQKPEQRVWPAGF